MWPTKLELFMASLRKLDEELANWEMHEEVLCDDGELNDVLNVGDARLYIKRDGNISDEAEIVSILGLLGDVIPDLLRMYDSIPKASSKTIHETPVYRCARCGKDHEHIVFVHINGDPITDEDGTMWDWWALCPVTGDPILMHDTVARAADGSAEA